MVDISSASLSHGAQGRASSVARLLSAGSRKRGSSASSLLQRRSKPKELQSKPKSVNCSFFGRLCGAKHLPLDDAYVPRDAAPGRRPPAQTPKTAGAATHKPLARSSSTSSLLSSAGSSLLPQPAHKREASSTTICSLRDGALDPAFWAEPIRVPSVPSLLDELTMKPARKRALAPEVEAARLSISVPTGTSLSGRTSNPQGGDSASPSPVAPKQAQKSIERSTPDPQTFDQAPTVEARDTPTDDPNPASPVARISVDSPRKENIEVLADAVVLPAPVASLDDDQESEDLVRTPRDSEYGLADWQLGMEALTDERAYVLEKQLATLRAEVDFWKERAGYMMSTAKTMDTKTARRALVFLWRAFNAWHEEAKANRKSQDQEKHAD